MTRKRQSQAHELIMFRVRVCCLDLFANKRRLNKSKTDRLTIDIKYDTPRFKNIGHNKTTKQVSEHKYFEQLITAKGGT